MKSLEELSYLAYLQATRHFLPRLKTKFFNFMVMNSLSFGISVHYLNHLLDLDH